MKNLSTLLFLAILIAFTGCKNTNLLKCPSVSSAKSHHEGWAMHRQHHEHNTANKQVEVNHLVVAKEKNEAVAPTTTNAESSFKIKIPRMVTHKLSEQELQSANEVFTEYSQNKVKIEKDEKGKLYLKADSKEDFFALAKTLISVKKTSAAASGGTGGLAIAGGILGIIAIILSLGPYVSYSAFLLGLLALIFGIIGLSSSRRGWAITGIVLGVLAILFAGVIGIGIYTIVLHY